MRKILLFILLFSLVWGLYESIHIYILLGKNDRDRGNTLILDRRGDLLGDISGKDGYSIDYSGSLDSALVKGILTIEDQRFYEHGGTDIVGKIGAIRDNYEAGTIVRGGSTLTEQYIKNTYFPYEPRTLGQKIREALWATIAEIRYTKDELLREYLNSVYMGNGIYGVESAANIYFSKSSTVLGEGEIVEIISRIHSPNLRQDDLYKSRVSRKLYGKDIREENLEKREKKKNTDIFPLLSNRIEEEISSYCEGKENSLIFFLKTLPTNICSEGSKNLVSGIDKDLSTFIRDASEGLLDKLEEKNIHNSAIYVWSEKEKKILAYIGNRSQTKDNAIDMIQEKRSVGSVLKPFIYKLALNDGHDGESYILDDTKVYKTEQEEKNYIPENYIPKSYGPIRLKEALGNSLNSATVRLTEWIGIGKIYEALRSYGIILDHDAGYYGYGISLGLPEVSLEKIVHAYRNILDLGEDENYMLFQILSDEKNRARTFGISSILTTSLPVAVKTGTSTDFRDNWAIGYTKDIIIGIWVGNSDGSSMGDVSGVTGAGPLFHQIAEYMIGRGLIEKDDSPLTSGLENTLLCLDTSCFQKESVTLRKNHTIESRPKNKIYKLHDFVTPMTDEERKKWKIQ